MLAEWRTREQDLGSPLGILFELATLGGGISITEDQQIDFGCRLAHLLNCHERTRRWWIHPVDELILGVDGHAPHFVEGCVLALFALLEGDLHKGRGSRKA